MSSRPEPPQRPSVRVTVAQLQVSDDHTANRQVVEDAFRTAARARADLLVLPEYASGFDPRGVGVEHAEPLDGPFVAMLRARAAATGVAVLAGTTLPADGDDPRAVNAVVGVDAAGDVVGVYRKVHLYDAFGQHESERLAPGPADAAPLVMDVGGLRFGVLTCYDLRFPESARRLVDAGAQVLVVPAAWAAGELKAVHWRTLAIARAIENTAAVVAVGQAGRAVTGRSLVVAPDGVVGLEMDTEPQVRTVDVDGAALLRVREQNPSLANRRYAVVPVV
ncbi:carbon-nitrogen hydrolase family protein [Cellulomonas fengjieae]|uniref:Carbon-nitrogen hydrolase family protein n=1 Tax=Cellulomonas fengjieae TaxID=2819978 RepID=A0ABS3SL74_9CELL|nr:carbon-nitrogen hydrolase family protein [Cellulomonas fengjieae]MBO3086498.1 carbon-nitrogen hydrolase family protein [Cellulomonas fengjieae]MBO3100494.1 carbon-nitrogen hydrolase family protein [Cellulomonas fengjieae]QVI66641.1 carbon-nitrogen hydrolase family protein [Cellulomonas fengjieae]